VTDTSDADRRDELVVGRAAQHEFRLSQRETDTGQIVFEWQWGERHYPGPEFVSRRHAIDWMAEYLAGETPSHGIDRRELPG
jgi:hypothetical protein